MDAEGERKQAPCKLIVQGLLHYCFTNFYIPINFVNFTACFLLGCRPTICELQLLELSDGRMLRIMESVAPQWKKMAVALRFSVARIKSIEKGEHYQPDDASFEIFSRWLEGEHDLKPPTWEVLSQCLKQASLLDIAEMLSYLHIVRFLN